MCREIVHGVKKYNELINSLVCPILNILTGFQERKNESLISIFYIEHTNDLHMEPPSLDELKQ